MSGRKRRNERGSASPFVAAAPKTSGGRDMEERVINSNMELQVSGIVAVNDPEVMTEELLGEVCRKAACWEITYQRLDGSSGPTYNGQVGLVRGNRLTPSPAQLDRARRGVENSPGAALPPNRFEATPVTARHNVIDFPGEDEYFGTCKMTFGMTSQTVLNPRFPDFSTSLVPADRIELAPADDEVEALTWKSHDVVWGETVGTPEHVLTQKNLSFEKIPPSLPLRAGVKIGIVVYRDFDIDVTDAGADMTLDKLGKLFGDKNSIAVFTGEILAMHNNEHRSFEHSINTYRGCSGAIVFLLDKNQPSLEFADQKGKAIGVHVGGVPLSTGRDLANIGFLF